MLVVLPFLVLNGIHITKDIASVWTASTCRWGAWFKLWLR